MQVETVKKMVRPLTFFLLLLAVGCSAYTNQPWLRQMEYENHIMSTYPYEEAMKILAQYYPNGSFPAPEPSECCTPPQPYFWDTWYYKNSIFLQSTYGRRHK